MTANESGLTTGGFSACSPERDREAGGDGSEQHDCESADKSPADGLLPTDPDGRNPRWRSARRYTEHGILLENRALDPLKSLCGLETDADAVSESAAAAASG